MDLATLFSDRFSFHFINEDSYGVQMVVVHSAAAACIQIQDMEVCLSGGESLSLSPETILGDSLVINPSQTRISIIPLLDIVHRSAFSKISAEIKEQRCHMTITFNGRREWINGVLLSDKYPHVNGNHYFILGSNQWYSSDSTWTFVDYQQSRDDRLIRMGGASKESFDTYLIISNAVEFCRSGVVRECLAYNPVKVNFGVFEFYKHVRDDEMIEMICVRAISFLGIYSYSTAVCIYLQLSNPIIIIIIIETFTTHSLSGES